jgi:hypothetical protein
MPFVIGFVVADRCPPAILFYTANDDGVHIGCGKCGFDHNLGFEASSRDVLFAEWNHTGGPDGVSLS